MQGWTQGSAHDDGGHDDENGDADHGDAHAPSRSLLLNAMALDGKMV